MSKPEFSSGPWMALPSETAIDGSYTQAIVRSEKSGTTIAEVSGSSRNANAHLIAAAPELYKELEVLRDWLADELGEWLPVLSDHYPNGMLIRMKENYCHIEDALRKARGESGAGSQVCLNCGAKTHFETVYISASGGPQPSPPEEYERRTCMTCGSNEDQDEEIPY